MRFGSIKINGKVVSIRDIETISLEDFRTRLEECGANVAPENVEGVYNKIKELCNIK